MIWLAAVAVLASSEHRSPLVTREFQRENPCPSTGRPYGPCPGWIKDHVIPLCAGGPDDPANMAWQTVEDAKKKDRVERRTCALLRRQRMILSK